MDPNQALRIAEQAISALEYAHYRGVIHGSLSLDDILVGANGRLTVLGVGVSQLQQLLGAPPAAASNALTPREVRAGEQPDARADVFAIGALLFVLLTGKMPSMGKPVTLSQDIPGLPPEVDAVLTKALAADPSDRYADLFEMSAALRVAPRSSKPAARRPASTARESGKATGAPVRPATETTAMPALLSGFPEALPMPEIDIAVFDQPHQMPEIAAAVALAMPLPPPMPTVDWDSLLRPVDLNAFGGLSIQIPVDQGLTAPPDPMLAAVQAVHSVENRPPKAGRGKPLMQHPTAVSSQKSVQVAQPPQAQPSSARRARKRKSPK
jgi:serine/threonine protein kinase